MINGSLLIKKLLSSNWISVNTTNRVPNFNEYYEKKRVNGFDDTDEALIYNRATTETPSAIGNISRNVVNRVCIDIRTNLSDLHINLMEKEIRRIIRTNVNYLVLEGTTHSTPGQQIIIEITNTNPFSNSENNNTFKNFRRVIELTLTSPKEEW